MKYHLYAFRCSHIFFLFFSLICLYCEHSIYRSALTLICIGALRERAQLCLRGEGIGGLYKACILGRVYVSFVVSISLTLLLCFFEVHGVGLNVSVHICAKAHIRGDMGRRNTAHLLIGYFQCGEQRGVGSPKHYTCLEARLMSTTLFSTVPASGARVWAWPIVLCFMTVLSSDLVAACQLQLKKIFLL
ncbi:hypothetical protein TRVL_05040 [Trypanosoma vivax]|nr:hypothetical protein TRVL_05040 [Trypanosoma vivax]